jgi:hypothetical protein
MITLAFLAAAAVAQPAPQPARPVYREIKDFVVACDNLRSCRVRWAPEAGDGGFEAYLDIARDGGAKGRLRISLGASNEGEARVDVRSLTLDGSPLGRNLRWRYDAEAAAMVVEGAEALTYLRAVSDGDVLTFSDGKQQQAVTLTGLKAALLAVDEAQGRLGTVGAFVRRGAAADATVPTPPPEPVVVARRAAPGATVPPGFAARVRRAQARALQQNDCDDARKDLDEAYALGDGEVLVKLGCMMHAYQSSMLLLRAPRGAPERARLVAMPPAAGDAPLGPDDAGRFVEGEWDPETATFFESAKGRGLADCGSSTSWVFDGTAFRLAEAHRMNRCSGGPPGDWPTVYRSSVEVR